MLPAPAPEDTRAEELALTLALALALALVRRARVEAPGIASAPTVAPVAWAFTRRLTRVVIRNATGRRGGWSVAQVGLTPGTLAAAVERVRAGVARHASKCEFTLALGTILEHTGQGTHPERDITSSLGSGAGPWLPPATALAPASPLVPALAVLEALRPWPPADRPVVDPEDEAG